MVPVILILILAFIALCNGDSSGFEAIGKVILYIGLFIGAGAIIVYAPWLILVVIIIAIIVAVTSFKSQSGNNSNNSIANDSYAEYKQQSNNIESSFVDNSNLSDFQRQLQENTKTPEQVEDENWLKEKETIKNCAKYDFSAIKRELLDKAQKGQYISINDHKCITFDYDCSYLLSCIDRQYSRNYTGKAGTPSFKLDEKVYYHIINEKQFALYLSTIKGLALQDNINISTFFAEINLARHRKNRITLPYIFTGGDGMGVSSHKIKVYLECSIRY